MSNFVREPLTAGFFPTSTTNPRVGYIRVFAWMAPEYGPRDPEIRRRPKLHPINSILVERYVTEETIGKPEVKWSNGDGINVWKRKEMRLSMQRRIERAMVESLRIAGGQRRA